MIYLSGFLLFLAIVLLIMRVINLVAQDFKD